MILRDDITQDYYEWLVSLIHANKYPEEYGYDKLLRHLHDIDFRYILERDQSRAEDGEYLRYRYAISEGYEDSYEEIMDILHGPCSVLELMIALAIRCEGDMDDALFGNRTGQWFWNMVVNLGLGTMSDQRYDRQKVVEIIDRFLDREYEPDGRGGLFTLKDCNYDLRKIEIWYQMCWYLDELIF